MSRIRVLICWVDDQDPDQMTELASFDMPEVDVKVLDAETALDDLEATTKEVGHMILRHLLRAQWEEVDEELVRQDRQLFSPEEVTADGQETVKVASQFGLIRLPRQVLHHQGSDSHVMPGNAVLPPHERMIITRGLQEWACLLPEALPFESATRLLGWQSQEAQVLSSTTVRSLVRRHGQIIRQAEQAQVKAVLESSDWTALQPQLVPHEAPRRRAAWPEELNAAVELALAAEDPLPPGGWGDSFVQYLLVLVLLCMGPHRSLLLIADGARWIRNFYSDLLAHIPNRQMILDWYHLRKKCYDLSSMICRGRRAKAGLLAALYRHLWRERIDEAIQVLEAHRPQAKNQKVLDQLIAYLQDRQNYIPDYCQRRQTRCYIGSAHAEKGNDLIVASRQKKQGMHWSLETSDALAALKTLLLNGGWELYWRQRQVLPLVAPA